MLFFIVCACFALFPEQVLYGAQNGLALCINAVIPSLLPFMLVSSCVIKSGFSRPLGAALSKVLSPLTNMSTAGCVCFVTGLFGGYGVGARAVYESYREKQLSREEAERILPFCNNAGPLFIIATVGISFFMSKSIGVLLFLVQLVTALICARVLSGEAEEKGIKVKDEWNCYKKNKPPLGELITTCAIESGGAIINACVFVITFSAILEILPFGEYSILSGILEVTRGCSELSREGIKALPLISAFLSWGGMSVHFQASALTKGQFNMKIYYFGKVLASVIAYLITKAVCAETYIFSYLSIGILLIVTASYIIKLLVSPKGARQRVFRQQQHS